MIKGRAYGKIILLNLTTTVFFLLGAVAAEFWSVPNTRIPPLLWPPTGISLAAVLLWGNKVIPGVWLGGFLVNFLLNWFGNITLHDWKFWLSACAIGIGLSLQAAFGAWITKHFTQTITPFYKLYDVFIFIFLGAYLACFISPLIANSIMLLSGIETLSEIGFNWLSWWFGDAVGILVFTSIILIWYRAKFSINRRMLIELAVLFLLLILVFELIFIHQYPLAFMLIPFCVWGAIRFNAQIAIVIAFLISVVGVTLETHGYKQFGAPSITSVIFMQSFVVVVFVTVLFLTAIMSERQKAQTELKKTNEELEDRVEQRTHDLNDKNQELNNALTALKQAEMQLVHAEKMSSLGVLTAGIAHEINNPVNFISANIDPLKADLADIKKALDSYAEITPADQRQKISDSVDLPLTLEEINRLLNGIAEGARRTATIVKDLRTFSHLEEAKIKNVNIEHNIEATLNLLHSQYKDRIEIIRNYGDIPHIDCYPDKLNQVFMNILTNAIQAIPDKGIITITSKKLDGKVAISIQDSGVGIKPENLEQVFVPFFTTKDVGKGTGLGLSISYSIIETHHGTITAKSELGKGSEFIITLPIKQP